MPLSPGTTLGPYQIDAPLGAGGMGEVYKATDTRLDRTVAIKVLPEHVASDPDLKQRFEREARTVAALNHPHICTLYDIGREGETDFLVMEYLDGQTVAQRLEKGALPLDQALQIAIDIADALDKAHRQGIVHRDLKPANIMLTKAGAKLLDFGLAKLKPPEQAGGLSALPTQPADLTQQGAILGTFQYMAPEQLEGQEADARTDIFAFGAVVYEMVTGRKAFSGKSQASLIGAILRDDPPSITMLQPISPPALDPIVKTCLAKEPDARWRSIGDVGRQLETIASGSASGSSVVTPSPAPRRTVWRQALPLVAALTIGAVITGLAAWGFMRQSDTTTDVVRFTVAGAERGFFGRAPIFAISRDGTQTLYSRSPPGGYGTQLYVRALDQSDGTPLRGTEDAGDVALSPNGEWVAFQREAGTLERVSIFGGAPQRVVRLPDSIAGATWGTDDQIIVGTDRGGLFRVAASGGEAESLTTLDAGEVRHVNPSVIPGHQAVLFVAGRSRGSGLTNDELAVLALETGQVTRLGLAGTGPRYVATGHLVYVADDRSLRAVPFDADELTVKGNPVTLVEGNVVNVSVSDNGRLCYVSVSGAAKLQLVWVDRTGQVVAPVVEVGGGVSRLSPDGTRVAVWIDGDIWIRDLARGFDTRLTENGGLFPVWAPDGSAVTFSSNRAGAFDLYSRAVDLSNPTELLLDVQDSLLPGSWSADGRIHVFHTVNAETKRDLWMWQVGEEPSPFLVTEFNESNPRLSPDGRWIAYASDQSAEFRIYVRPFPGGERVIPVSTGAGSQAVWSRDGRTLFYRNRNQMLAVAVEPGPEFMVGETTVLFEEPYLLDPGNAGGQTYDVSLDGQQFLMVQMESEAFEYNIVLNWFEELKARVPVP